MAKVRILTRGEFDDWKAHPATRMILQFLWRCREDLKSQWVAGAFQDPDAEKTARANYSALEKHHAYTEIIDLDYDQYYGVMTDDEPTDNQRKRP
jgi:hypothetical protein